MKSDVPRNLRGAAAHATLITLLHILPQSAMALPFYSIRLAPSADCTELLSSDLREAHKIASVVERVTKTQGPRHAISSVISDSLEESGSSLLRLTTLLRALPTLSENALTELIQWAQQNGRSWLFPAGRKYADKILLDAHGIPRGLRFALPKDFVAFMKEGGGTEMKRLAMDAVDIVTEHRYMDLSSSGDSAIYAQMDAELDRAENSFREAPLPAGELGKQVVALARQISLHHLSFSIDDNDVDARLEARWDNRRYPDFQRTESRPPVSLISPFEVGPLLAELLAEPQIARSLESLEIFGISDREALIEIGATGVPFLPRLAHLGLSLSTHGESNLGYLQALAPQLTSLDLSYSEITEPDQVEAITLATRVDSLVLDFVEVAAERLEFRGLGKTLSPKSLSIRGLEIHGRKNHHPVADLLTHFLSVRTLKIEDPYFAIDQEATWTIAHLPRLFSLTVGVDDSVGFAREITWTLACPRLKEIFLIYEAGSKNAPAFVPLQHPSGRMIPVRVAR